jgi:hypothetical protein
LPTRLVNAWLADSQLELVPETSTFASVASEAEALAGSCFAERINGGTSGAFEQQSGELSERIRRMEDKRVGILANWLLDHIRYVPEPGYTLRMLVKAHASDYNPRAFVATPITALCGDDLTRFEELACKAKELLKEVGIHAYCPIEHDSPRRGPAFANRLEVFAQDEGIIARSCIVFIIGCESSPGHGLGTVSKLASTYGVHRVVVQDGDSVTPMIAGDGHGVTRLSSPDQIPEFVSANWAMIAARAVLLGAELPKWQRKHALLIRRLGENPLSMRPREIAPRRWNSLIKDPVILSSLTIREQEATDRRLVEEGLSPLFAPVRLSEEVSRQFTVADPSGLPALPPDAFAALNQAADELGWDQAAVNLLSCFGRMALTSDGKRVRQTDPVFWYKLKDQVLGHV